MQRTKSEGHVHAGSGASAVPEVCTDATLHDRLWSRLEPGNHRDSVSSSSSISSSDTVIDLSLPNLARKGLGSSGLPREPPAPESPWVGHPRSATSSAAGRHDAPRISKSKSNPNLRNGDTEGPEDELQPRPLLGREAGESSGLARRRHTWSRLYMEGLRQASSASKRPSPAAPEPGAGGSMSKSLGDLTSDDIRCNFDSKYRSISRSFVVRPARNRQGAPRESRDDLAERLRRLTNVEPLTTRDFASPTEPPGEVPMRRTSSRSQSRVRYIANRAKQAQERQRLQGTGGGSPIEERGSPEGACCVASSPCAGLDLLSQLPPGPPHHHGPLTLENNEFFFRLKL